VSKREWKITDRLICEAQLVVNMANEWNSRPREISAAWAHVFDFAREVLAGTAGQPSADVFMDWRNVVSDARKLDHYAELIRLRSLEWKAKAAGFVDDKGEVRKVLGQLDVLGSGEILAHGADLMVYHGDEKQYIMVETNGLGELMWGEGRQDVRLWHSTPGVAKAAKCAEAEKH
jgi:hypothetical protein